MSNRQQLIGEAQAAMREFMTYAVFFHDMVARAAGLNSTDLMALGLLLDEGPSSPGQLARRTGITAGGAITSLIDRLEASGFAYRSRDTQDRRRVLVTAASDQVESRLAPLYAEVARQWEDYLTARSERELRIGLDLVRTATAINRAHVDAFD